MENQRRTGLVLEGGGMRGIYTAGVLDVFLEHDITFDGVIGVSAGALHGCSYVAGQHGRSIRYYKKYCRDRRFMSLYNILHTGDIADERFCYHDIPERLDPYDYEAFDRSNTEFYVTCSNVETGRAEHLRITDMRGQVDLMRASASLPCISRIVDTAGLRLLDGGCTDSIPVMAMRRMGYRRIVAVLTRQRGYRKKPENTLFHRHIYRDYPAFVQAVKRRHLAYNRTLEHLERLEAEGKIFVIAPEEALPIGRLSHNPRRLQEVYDIGRRDAENSWERMLAWRDKGCKER
ncbi:MAG: patatin family protein [Clostridiales bacterium]|nr:patatin family protein [Clostridiales bacterium]